MSIKTGDMVTVGKGTTPWLVVSVHNDIATLRTGVGRFGRQGRTIMRTVDKLTAW